MDDRQINRLWDSTSSLCKIPGLSGYEERVAEAIRRHLGGLGLSPETDTLGNVWTTLKGKSGPPSILLFAHMDQLGFVVRKVENDGRILFERLGGVPEKSIQGQRVVISVENRDIPAIIASKSHHVTQHNEKFAVLQCKDLFIDAGFESADAVRNSGIDIGSPVTYMPWVNRLGEFRVAGTSIDDRAGCAVVLEVARLLMEREDFPTTHILFSVQEEFNLRGVVPAAQKLNPDIAIQVDLAIATDTPEVADLGEVKLGGGPAMSLYNFHGRGTLNGVIPHPGLVRHVTANAANLGVALQRSVQVGILTDLSLVQVLNHGVASLDVGFPMRYSHSATEICDLRDLASLSNLLAVSIATISDREILKRD